MKVLIADDEYMILKSLELFFEEKGFDIVLAKDGKEACDLLYENDFDFVCTDLIMPYRSGIEVLKTSKNKSKVVPVAILTGVEDDEYQELADAYGADYYLFKPFNKEKLSLLLGTI